MNKVYIRTYAYNAEKTLRRAVESILNQTHTDFVYYLCDNGSTDGTRKIVEDYASQDSRIKAFYNKTNCAFDETKECILLPYHIEEEDYYCTLDADDEYFPNFLEEMIAFMEKYNLDIAACGSDFVSVAEDDRLIEKRMINQDLILQGRDFEKFFPTYHIFMRTMWGKLYKGRVLRNIIQGSTASGFPSAYGGDTFNTMRAFSSANQAGILSKSLHRYYVSRKSVSYRFHPQRVETDQILHRAALAYLEPYGKLSRQNEDFLFAIYMNALKDTAVVLLNSAIPLVEKIKHLSDIVECEYTRQLVAKENFGIYVDMSRELQKERRTFFASLDKWLRSLEEVPDEQMENYCDAGEFICAAAGLSEGWIFFQKLRIQFLLLQKHFKEADQKLIELEAVLPNDENVLEFRKELGQLKS